MTFFPEKNVILTPKLSNDFLVIDLIKCHIRPFLHKKNHYFRKEFIFYSVHPFARIRQHYFSKYWGANAWAVPHLKFWGARSPSPRRSPPLTMCIPVYYNYL